VAAYLTREDLELSIGKDLVAALFSEEEDTGDESDDRIEKTIAQASAMTQLYALSKGYTVGDSFSDPLSATNELLQLATIGAVTSMAYARGEKAVPLPGNWSDHPARRAYSDLLKGDLPLPGAALESIAGIGGWSFSATNATDGSGPAARRTSKRNMAGFGGG
jgi:hypothetical protein